MALKSGSVVQAHCGACRADTRHVVVKAARGVPSRVRCRSCGREHVYKPRSAAAAVSKLRPPAPKAKPATKPVGKPGGKPMTKPQPVGKPSVVAAAKGKSAAPPAAAGKKPAAARTAQPVGKASASGRPAPPPAREPELSPYEKALKEAENRPPEAYRISGLYRERQRLQHGVFGLGVVTKVLQSNVFEAMFADGPRKLAMAREEPKRGRGVKAPKVVAPGPVKPAPTKSAPAKSAPAKSGSTRPPAAKSVPPRSVPVPAKAAARPAAAAKAPAKSRRS